MAISEHHIALLQQVVLEGLPVIDGLDLFVDRLVDIGRLGKGILLLHVGHDAFLDVLVDQLHLSLAKSVFFGQLHDVLEDAFGAEDLGVLISHVILGEGVEGRRENVVAHISHPLLQNFIIKLALALQFGNIDGH